MRRFVPLVTLILFVSPPLALTADLPRAKPEEVGLSAKALESIPAELDKLVTDKKIPGALVVVARHGKVAGMWRNLGTKDS